MARKSNKKGDLVSALALSKLLGRDRQSVTRWAETEGMPFDSRPDAGGAGEWKFWTAEVVDWLVARDTQRAVEKLEKVESVSDEEMDTMTVAQAEQMKARWDAVKSRTSALMQILALQKEGEELIEKGVIGAVYSAQIARARHAFGNLDARVAARVPDVEQRVLIAGLVRDEVEAICAELTVPEHFDTEGEPEPAADFDFGDEGDTDE